MKCKIIIDQSGPLTPLDRSMTGQASTRPPATHSNVPLPDRLIFTHFRGSYLANRQCNRGRGFSERCAFAKLSLLTHFQYFWAKITDCGGQILTKNRIKRSDLGEFGRRNITMSRRGPIMILSGAWASSLKSTLGLLWGLRLSTLDRNLPWRVKI